MRTASQIFEEELSGEPLTQESVIEAIKIAQLETIEESCRVCAENADADVNFIGWLSENQEYYNIVAGQDYEVYVLKNSILNCAEILKKEIE